MHVNFFLAATIHTEHAYQVKFVQVYLYLQCTNIGPTGNGGLYGLTTVTKFIRCQVFLGHPWSGHLKKWNCFILCVLIP